MSLNLRAKQRQRCVRDRPIKKNYTSTIDSEKRLIPENSYPVGKKKMNPPHGTKFSFRVNAQQRRIFFATHESVELVVPHAPGCTLKNLCVLHK